jgi:NAD(P)-dependent dehydrogenase (short-subunit alcohol dehydrogenase family)
MEKVAIVTGAGQGIGRGIAGTLSREGYRVAVIDLDSAKAEAAARELSGQGPPAIARAMDVTDAKGWTRLAEHVAGEWGRVDVLVNNAGISPRGTIDSTDEALWDRTLATNLKGPWLGIRACLASLRACKGTIINIGSTHSTLPMRGLFSYCVSKAGLLGLTRQVATELLSDEVTCNMIAPGWVASEGERLIQAREGRPNFPEGVRNMSTAEDVGAAVVFLCSPSARRVTGELLHLDGGLHAVGDVKLVHGNGP